MQDVTQIIDLWNTSMLNVWNTLRNHGGIWFYVVVAIVVVFPLLRRMVRAIRGNR